MKSVFYWVYFAFCLAFVISVRQELFDIVSIDLVVCLSRQWADVGISRQILGQSKCTLIGIHTETKYVIKSELIRFSSTVLYATDFGQGNTSGTPMDGQTITFIEKLDEQRTSSIVKYIVDFTQVQNPYVLNLSKP